MTVGVGYNGVWALPEANFIRRDNFESLGPGRIMSVRVDQGAKAGAGGSCGSKTVSWKMFTKTKSKLF